MSSRLAPRLASRLAALAGPRLAATLLGAACAAWAAAPGAGSGWARTALAITVIAVAAGSLRLVLTDVPEPQDRYYVSSPERLWLWFLAAVRLPPWEEIAVAAAVWLEVMHPGRPWHTFALGAGLVAYLLAVHIAESGTRAGRLLRGQAKVLAAGACLMAAGAGAAMVPAGAPGAGSALLRVLAAIAVIIAAALVLPA